MRIALDAMGGDNAPGEIIKGAIEAAETLDADDGIIIVGIQDRIESHLAQTGGDCSHITVVHAPEVIGMNEAPIDALKKKRKSSIAIMAKMASRGQADAVISAGNTGACVAGCQLRMRNLENVNRSGIAAVLPMLCGPVTMCDVGANISCKPVNLYQYAVMASLYSKQVLGVENPRVGLMSIGEEETKGNELVKKTRELLKSDSNLNFIGNIEGRDLFYGKCDVTVCEGFVGNVILKLTEGLAGMLFQAIKQELMEKDISLASKFKPIIGEIYRKYDYHEYGGAPLLGVKGNAIICHGSSKSKTIRNAIMASKKFYTNKINQQIVDYLSNSSIGSDDGK
jgi:phosphate acyltransferase